MPQVLWLPAGQDRGWSTSGLWFVIRIPVKLGYLKFCGFAVKILVGVPQQVCGFAVRIPVGIPQVLWLRGQYLDWDTSSFAELLWLRGQDLGLWLRVVDPGWDTSSVVVSRARSRLGYLEFVRYPNRDPDHGTTKLDLRHPNRDRDAIPQT